MRVPMLFGITYFLLSGWLIAQEGKIQSGPKVGEVLPGPFDAFNINGKNAKGRQHCLVCEYGLQPVVMVFAREPAAGKDGPLMSLLTKLDEALSRHAEEPYPASFAVFLSPDAQDSTNNAGEQDSKKIVEEALAREVLIKRLEARAEKLKNVVVAYFPAEGPKDYQINPKAEVTVLFYQKHKVLANFSFAEGQLAPDNVARIVKTVEETLAKSKAAP